MTRRPQKSTLFPYPTLFRALLMLAGLGLFVELDWGRFPLWLAALAAGALAFAALGLAIGALTRGVCSASLLAFMLDRKSTRLNSSHANLSYAVFCLKKPTHK